MNIETRQKMLEHTNKLRGIVHVLNEYQDIWMSDVKALEEMIYDFQQEFNLVSRYGEHSYHSNLVLGDNDDKE